MNKIKTFAAIVLAAHAGFAAGYIACAKRIHADLLAADLAHYDARTGSVVYGPPPPVLEAADLFSEDQDKEKPKVIKKQHTTKKSAKTDGIFLPSPPPPLREYVYSPQKGKK